MSNEKIKLDEIEYGDKLEQLIELLPTLIEYEKNKNKLLNNKPPDNSKIVSIEIEE
mgnify:CR=1 FL=1